MKAHAFDFIGRPFQFLLYLAERKAVIGGFIPVRNCPFGELKAMQAGGLFQAGPLGY